MMSQTFSVSHLSKTFPNNLHALCDISFSVQKGEFVSIIGPSGCGKSTLFNILAGVEQETAGHVFSGKKKMTRRVGAFGYMPQSPLLLPWRSVLQNVMLGLLIRHVSKSIAEKQARDFLKEFGLLSFADMYPGALSGGMQQRIALLRTILFQKEFLLLDEPFGALDALTRFSCQMWLLDIHRMLHPTILFITHDVREAMLLSDTIYVLGPSPARIKTVFHVGLKRPRHIKQLTTEKSLRLEQDILSYLVPNTDL
jgi:NitT/TauT family transport system ATP-binding protein